MRFASSSEERAVSELLRNGKKTCQSLESLNYDVRARIYAQITILVPHEHETDAKNRTLTNSASELTNSLEMVKKTCQSLEPLNYDVRSRI